MSREFKYKDVLQAWMDGKEIQYRWRSEICTEKWLDYIIDDVPDVITTEDDYEWRIKPQKRTVWVNIYKHHSVGYWTGGTVFTDEESAKTRRYLPEYVTTISIEEECTHDN